MKPMWKRLAAALVIAWPVINHPAGFSVPKAAKSGVSPKPAGPPELEAAKQAVEAIVKDPTAVAKISAVVKSLMDILGSFQKVTDWVNSLNSAGKAWREWEGTDLKVYGSGGNMEDHISSLMETINKISQPGSNIILGEENSEVPSEPVRGTYLECLMLGVLCDKARGMSAIFAESGTGKSVAVLLAVTEVARAMPEDLFVVLKDDLDTNLRTFFGVENLGYTAKVARALFSALSKKKKTLHLIFDNVLDSGTIIGSAESDILKGLARAAYEHGQQIVFTTQFQEAAESIAALNGATTFMADVQDRSYGAYRWSRNETIALIRSLHGDPINEILECSRIPDWRGGWRPRETKAFMERGQRPSAPLKREGTAPTASVWVRQLREDGDAFKEMGAAFQVKGDLQNVDDLKKAIEKEAKLTIAAFKLTIYSKSEDSSWQEEEEDAELNRGTSKLSTWSKQFVKTAWNSRIQYDVKLHLVCKLMRFVSRRL